MFSTTLTTLLLATGAIVNSMPLGSDISDIPAVNATEISLHDAGILSENCSKEYDTAALMGNSTLPRVIQPYEVLLYGNGRMEVVHETVYQAMLDADDLFNVNTTTPTDRPLSGTDIEIVDDGNGTSPIDARCTWYEATQITQTQDFIDWDVPMSSVVQGDNNGKTTIAVTAGYTIANSISISVQSKWTMAKDFLETTFGISYTKTWTSSYATAYTFGITPGKYGVVVSRPRVTRRIGRTLAGCVGSMSTTSTFTADAHYQGSFNSLNWVQGAITTCERNSYPVARCLGSGNIY
jgi:hypothetical protein